MHLPWSGPDGLIRRPTAVELGTSDIQLHRATESGELHRLHRGSYAVAAAFDALDLSEQHVARVRAAVAAQRNDVVVSHQSAAAVWGLPFWNVDLSRVHLTQDKAGTGRRTQQLHVHSVTPGSVSTELHRGLRVTTPARTIFDVATAVPFESAVVLADAALYRKLCTPVELSQELIAGEHRRGRRAAAAVIAFADGRSESAGESRSRVGMFRAGLAKPELQFKVYGPGRRLAGRTDFAWELVRLVGEFDGLSKYGRLLKPGQKAEDVFLAERDRQNLLHDLGYEMVRWIWSELARPDLLYPRIQRSMDRAARIAARSS